MPIGIAFAILSAVLFGASTPLAKLLLGDGVNPWLLAGLLYLGSGVGLALVRMVRPRREAPIRVRDLPRLALVVAIGGVAAPVLLMVGLATTPAASASLLLNLEGLATMAIAWLVFRESVDRRLLIGAAAILSGAVVLSWGGGPTGFGIGSLAIVAACVCWGVDNNLTRGLSAADPVQLTMIKGLAAGAVNLALALATGAALPELGLALAAGAVGFFGYGVSLVLFVLGLRHLGTARTGAYFSTAPFIGAALSLVLLSDPITIQLVAAGLLMAIGVYLHVVEVHDDVLPVFPPVIS